MRGGKGAGESEELVRTLAALYSSFLTADQRRWISRPSAIIRTSNGGGGSYTDTNVLQERTIGMMARYNF